jgi:toluene monooxygenase system ferredoxin subunit
MSFEAVLEDDELWSGEMRALVVQGRRVLLVRAGETVCAYADRCAHLGVPLSQGKLEAGVITCGAHHYQYDARTGCGVNPTSVHLQAFPVRVENGNIEVDVDGALEESA